MPSSVTLSIEAHGKKPSYRSKGQRPGKGISSFPSFRCPLEEDLPSFFIFSTTFPERSGASSYVVTTRVVSNSASHPTTEQPAVRYRQQNDNIVTTR